MKRAYGIVGIRAKMSNWNADLSGRAKRTLDGTIFGSDKALKYPMRRFWKRNGKPVFSIATYKEEKKKGAFVLQPLTIDERYESLSGEIEKDVKPSEIIDNLLSFEDVRQFGITFASAKASNVGLTGAVQFGQGINLDPETTDEIQDIRSPWRNLKKDEGEQSSLGKVLFVNEAHYFYGFSVDPRSYEDFSSFTDKWKYTEEDFENFKEAARKAVTMSASTSKFGCDNEFALFVTFDTERYLPDLSQYVKFYRENGKPVIDLTSVEELIGNEGKVEVYADPFKIEVRTKYAVENIFK